MAAIVEDYVSFETAKLLKEKGFDEACWSWYHNGNNTHTGTSRYCNSELEKYDFSKATLAHVMKWLREVHHLHICIECGVGAYVWTITNTSTKIVIAVNAVIGSYERAAEAAIKYCLENLIHGV